MRTRVQKVVVLGVSLLLAIGISAGSLQGKVTITWDNWLSAEAGFRPGINKLIEMFEAENPDIDVEIESIPYANYRDQLVYKIVGGTAPDCATMPDDFTPAYASMQALIDLSDFYTEEIRNTTYPAAIGNASFQGKEIGIPFYAGTWIVYYNTKLFEDQGIDPLSADWTWQDYERIARKITNKVDKIYGAGIQRGAPVSWQPNLNWWAQAKSNVFDQDFNIIVNNEGGVEAMSFLVNLAKADLCPPGSPTVRDMRRLFGEGNLGMWMDGPWMMGILEAESPGFETWTAASMPYNPKYGKTAGSFLISASTVIFRQAKHKEEAKKLALFFLSKGVVQEEIYNMIGLCANKFTYANLIKGNVVGKVHAAEMEKAASPNYPAEWGRIADLFVDQSKAAFLGIKTPKQAMDDLAHDIGLIIGDKYKKKG